MLTGRDTEQQHIDELLQQAAAGGSGVLVLRGDPGIGKTALVDYAARRAGTMRILRATGIEAENELGFAGLYSLLLPVASYLEALPGRQASALRAALGLGDVQATPDRLAVATGTHALLTTAAEHSPLLILVDDLHWLDPASQEALLFTLRRLDRDAVACLMTLRHGSAGPVGLPCRDLAGLSPDATERLVETIAGTKPAAEVARRLHAETGGNPLALVELSATLTADQLGGAELPEAPLEPGAAIRLRFAARLDRLSAPVRTALLVAAAAGRCPLPDVIAAAGHLACRDPDVFAEAETAGLIQLARGGVEFSHPLVRSVAYHLATPALRRAAHLALAGQLSGRDAERAAWHLAAAATGPDDAAAGALDVAAALAARKGAPLEAAAAWERAEAIARYEGLRRLTADSGIAHPYYSTIPDLIEAYARAGTLDRAQTLLPEFLASVPGRANPQSAARAARCRGITAADDFDTPFREALAQHERGDVVFQHARTYLAYGERLRRAQRRREARVQLRAAAEIFDRLDARPWAERARAELRASGETLARGGDGGERLTPQELQIALLVSEGRTNAEVGRAVFLSTRTVEFHLSRAYRKLGVASRTELTRKLATAGAPSR